MTLPRITSLRAKLFLAAIAVQALMLFILTTQNLDFINAQFEERAELRLDEEKKLLAALLADPMRRNDRTAIEAVLSRARSNDGIMYLVVMDKEGKTVARNGWNAATPLPPGIKRKPSVTSIWTSGNVRCPVKT